MIDFVTGNYLEIFAAIGMFLTFATAVAKITPTPADDKLVAKARKVFEFFSFLKNK